MGQFFDNHRHVRCLRWTRPPHKRSMSGDENGRYLERIEILKSSDNSATGIEFIIVTNLLGRHVSRDRNGSSAIVRVSGAEASEIEAGLRPGSGISRMCVNDSPDPAESSIQSDMGEQIRRR